MAQDPYTQQLLLDWFVELDTPEGFRAEVVEGEFILTPLPDGHHERCISRIVQQLHRRSRRCYARGGIPFYLLVDRDRSSTTLFSEPEKGDYRRLGTAAFGRPLTLPEPFAFDLDTTDFL
ncbi:hypothetical protein [Streptomyces coeruleorubidus]